MNPPRGTAVLTAAVLLFAPAPATIEAFPGPRPTASFADSALVPAADRVRDYDMIHSILDLRVDWEARGVEGSVTHRLAPLREGLRFVHLDQHRMKIRSVRHDGGQVLAWTTPGDTLTVELERPYHRGEELTLRIEYRVEAPSRGMHWVLPDAHAPARSPQMWTQGQCEENHYWFPCYDFPNDRGTSEEFITVATGLTAVGNGELVEIRDNLDDTRTWHYRMDVPHVSYLQSMVVGEFAIHEQTENGVPILSYVKPASLGDAPRSFAATGEMMRLYEELAGMPYPYPVYRQVAVDRFLYGGMENIAASTLTSSTLHPESVAENYSSASLVSHELSHQWWGDLITPASWTHIWLNEGFTTYCETLWFEHDEGVERAQWSVYQNALDYLASDQGYRRPLVTRYFDDPDELFDEVAYQKGGVVLHMLRGLLGDRVFREGIQRYTRASAGRVVETEDLRRAMFEVSGNPLDVFFDQWVYRAGHPEFKVRWDWDPEGGLVHLDVRQVQEVTDLTPLFEVTAMVDLTGEGWERRVKVKLDGARQEFYFEAPARPVLVEFDRDEWILKSLDFERDESETLFQLRESPSVISRARAAEALGIAEDDSAVPVLAECLEDPDEFWGVRAEAAKALGRRGDEASGRALVAAVGRVEHGRVLEAMAEALGNCPDAAAIAALETLFREDPRVPVAGAALEALAHADGNGLPVLAREAMDRDSWRDTLRRSAVAALETRGNPDDLPLLESLAGEERYHETRVAALKALGTVAGKTVNGDPRRREILQFLEGALEDPIIQVRSAAARGLGSLGEPGAADILRRGARADEHPEFVHACRKALLLLEEAAGGKTRVDELEGEVETLRQERDELQRDLRQLDRKRKFQRPAPPHRD